MTIYCWKSNFEHFPLKFTCLVEKCKKIDLRQKGDFRHKIFNCIKSIALIAHNWQNLKVAVYRCYRWCESQLWKTDIVSSHHITHSYSPQRFLQDSCFNNCLCSAWVLSDIPALRFAAFHISYFLCVAKTERSHVFWYIYMHLYDIKISEIV